MKIALSFSRHISSRGAGVKLTENIGEIKVKIGKHKLQAEALIMIGAIVTRG